jgi:DHA1 family inner membrane transport protein
VTPSLLGGGLSPRAGGRWIASYATFGIPQASVSIAFALVALPLTGDAGDGALLVLGMTLAQIVGAVPVARCGSRLNAVVFLRVLIATRTCGLLAVAALATVDVPFGWLVVAASVAGFVNGAAYGYLRATLNHVAPSERMPRMLGIANTLNELTFVITPIVTSLIGSLSVVASVIAPAILGAAPLLLLPRIPHAVVPYQRVERKAPSPRAVLWLTCAVATSSAVAGVEIGAVSIAVGFGMNAGWGALFAASLCTAAVVGGTWVSVRNARLRAGGVVGALAVTAAGAALVAVNVTPWLTVVGAVMIGAVLAPLGIHYSLTLDDITPPHQRPEIFALYRASTAVGMITASAIIAYASTSAALGTAAAATALASMAVLVVVR